MCDHSQIITFCLMLLHVKGVKSVLRFSPCCYRRVLFVWCTCCWKPAITLLKYISTGWVPFGPPHRSWALELILCLCGLYIPVLKNRGANPSGHMCSVVCKTIELFTVHVFISYSFLNSSEASQKKAVFTVLFNMYSILNSLLNTYI